MSSHLFVFSLDQPFIISGLSLTQGRSNYESETNNSIESCDSIRYFYTSLRRVNSEVIQKLSEESSGQTNSHNLTSIRRIILEQGPNLSRITDLSTVDTVTTSYICKINEFLWTVQVTHFQSREVAHSSSAFFVRTPQSSSALRDQSGVVPS